MAIALLLDFEQVVSPNVGFSACIDAILQLGESNLNDASQL